MNQSTHAVTLVTSAFPFITKAIHELLLDNGCVNRTEPGINELTISMWTKIRERYEGEESLVINMCEAELSALTQSEFEECVIGEQGVVKTTPMLDSFLEFIFESL